MAWLPPSIKGKTVHHYDLPAWWSGALLNNDRTSLALDAEDLAEFEEWAGQNPHCSTLFRAATSRSSAGGTASPVTC